jgi:hypothetical protein
MVHVAIWEHLGTFVIFGHLLLLPKPNFWEITTSFLYLFAFVNEGLYNFVLCVRIAEAQFSAVTLFVSGIPIFLVEMHKKFTLLVRTTKSIF